MILAAQEADHLPWLGFFDRMRRADVFVLIDHVPFERHSPHNRTRIRTLEGPRWLTVPVFQGADGRSLRHQRIDNHRQGRTRWGRKAAATLAEAYAAAPHYKDVARRLEPVLEARWDFLIDLNIRLLAVCREALGLRTPVVLSSQVEVQGTGAGMLLQLCRALKAKTYLAGAGEAGGPGEAESFMRAGIELRRHRFRHPRYEQHPADGAGFVEGLSVVDLLFNCGPASGSVLGAASPEGAGDGR